MLPLIMGGAGVLMKGVGMASAAKNRREAMKQLRALQKTQRPTFGMDPMLSGLGQSALSSAASPTGFTGAEKGAYMQGMNRLQNTQMSRGLSMSGGSQARALSAVLGANQANAMNQFAMNDATLARNSRSSALQRAFGVANTRQNLSNMQTQSDLSYRNMMEQGYGAAIRQNRDYITGSLANMGGDLISGATMLGMGDNNDFSNFALPRFGRRGNRGNNG